tara:strand:- start:3364 stop:5061 length:1698 start_codon:yes stop_codon:yes gene_type:complete
MNTAEKFVRILKKNQINEVFIYPGGTIAPIINACERFKVKIHTFKSEQGAGYAAIGAYKTTKKPQILMVTSGPGVTNALTPLADAFYDSIPLFLIAGQISTDDLSKRKKVRQRGFQEVPTLDLVNKISKDHTLINNTQNFERKVQGLIEKSNSGRPGPIVIDFPMNIQKSIFSEKKSKLKKTQTKKTKINKNVLNQINNKILNSKKPLLLLGNGANDQKNFDLIKKLVSKYNFQVVTSLLGVGAYDTDSINHHGYIGHTGHIAANFAAYTCDFLLVLGSRLDLRQTGTEIKKFCPEAYKVMVDIDKIELKFPRVKVNIKVNQSVNSFLINFLKIKNKKKKLTRNNNDWLNYLIEKKDLNLEDEFKTKKFVNPKKFIKKVSKKFKNKPHSVVTGVGIHQQWTARHYSFNKNIFFLTSGGHGTMGFDIPSSIGASIKTKKPVLCFVGDGSIMMNIQELKTISEKKLNIKIFLFNNERLGIVSQFQKITFGNDPTTKMFKTPNFKTLSKSFDLKFTKIVNDKEVDKKIKNINKFLGPELIEVKIDYKADVSPMLLAGYKMNEMWYSKY